MSTPSWFDTVMPSLIGQLDSDCIYVSAERVRFAVRSGETIHLPEVYADETNDYDICDVQGKMCF